MISKSSYAVTGVFVLVLGVVFIWGVLWISSGGRPLDFDRYLIYMTDSVSGLNVDAGCINPRQSSGLRTAFSRL